MVASMGILAPEITKMMTTMKKNEKRTKTIIEHQIPISKTESSGNTTSAPEDIELPFHIMATPFTITPKSNVYTDEYLGYDGGDTAREPLYSYDTLRFPEAGILKNNTTEEVRKAYSDEIMKKYILNGWTVTGSLTMDGFYRLESMNIQKERGMGR